MQFTPVLLLLALSMSWPRFIIIFRPGTDGAVAQSPGTLVASAVSISSLGLAIADGGAMAGLLLILLAVWVSRILRTETSSAAVIASCASMCAYLQFAERVG